MYKIRKSSLIALASFCFMTLSHAIISQAPVSIEYSVGGTIENFDIDHHMRMYRVNPVDQSREEVANSEISDKGEYLLRFDFTGPDLYRLDFPGRQTVMLIVNKDQTSIQVDTEGKRGGYVHIKGSRDSEILFGYEEFRKKSNSKLVSPAYGAMRAARKAGNVEAEVDAVEEYVKGSKEHRKELLDYIEKNVGTSMALYGTMLRWTGDVEVERLDRLVAAFESVHPDSKAAAGMRDKVERYKRIAIGAKAPNLSASTPNGETLALKDIDADYILIDFWASWCSPCISQVPDLHKVYTDFKDQGFEILSVSIDGKADKWKASINKHNLNWLHISDLKVWKSELAQNYNVTFVPFNLIVDRNGTIVAKNMHSKTLHTKLTELFAGK